MLLKSVNKNTKGAQINKLATTVNKLLTNEMKKILVIFLFFSLNSYSQDIKFQLLGDWGFFTEPNSIFSATDSLYQEICFEPDTFTINNRVIGIGPPISYRIENDTLFIKPITDRDAPFKYLYTIQIIDNNKIKLENELNNYLLFRIDSSGFTISKWIHEYSKIYNLRNNRDIFDSISLVIDNKYEAKLRQREFELRCETNKIKKNKAIEIINSILSDENYKDEYEFYSNLKKELEKKDK